MKKFLLCLLGAALCLQFVGCTEAPAESAGTVSADRVGLCLRQQADAPEYYDAILSGLQAAGYDVTAQDAKNDQSMQDAQVESLLRDDCQLLIVEPVMVTALETVVEAAKAKNVPLLLIDREPAREVLDSYDRLYFAGCQISEVGAAQAQLLQQLPLQGDLNEDGVVSYMVLRGPEDHMDAQAITDGCLQALASYTTEQIGITATQWELAAARADCAGMLAQYGRDIEVIFCNHAVLAQGAVEAVENRGWIPGQDVYILAVDNNDSLQMLIDKGAVFGTVAADVQQRVRQILELSGKLILENWPDKCTYAPYVSVTAKP